MGTEGDISRDDMQAMNRRYDAQLASLRERLENMEEGKRTPQEIRAGIQKELAGLLGGEIESEAFYKHLLDGLTVYQDRHLELRLRYLPQVFLFA